MSQQTKTRAAEQQLLMDRYRSILQTSMDGVWWVDMQGRLLEVNASYCAMSGYSEQELLNLNIADLEDQESSGDIAEHTRKVMERGEDRFETRHRRKDGTVFDIEISVRYLPGQSDQMIAFLRDITSRKQAEEALWNEKAFLRCVIDSANDLIYFKDLNSVYLGCNRASEIFTGVAECDQVGKTDFDLLDHATAVICRERDKLVMAGETAAHAEEWVTYPDGRRVLLDTLKTPIFDKNGRAVGLVGISRDITDRKEMENALRASENRYRSLMENIPAIVYKYSTRSGGLFYSPQVEQVFEYPLQAFYDNPLLWKNSIHPEDTMLVEQAIARTCDHGETGVYVEYRVRNRSGNWIWLRDSLIQREISSKGIEIFGIATDITERKQAEEERIKMEMQLHQAQKLESLGVLAGGIAHDFNNILAIIIGHCSLAQLRPESAESRLATIENAAERAAELCRQMLAYAGKTEFVRSRIDMWVLVDEMVRMLQSTISQNVTIIRDLADTIPDITGDAGQLRQIVMNLIINATEAIGENRGGSQDSTALHGYQSRTVRPGLSRQLRYAW
ncbi:MAG TPA: PAS domain S-box protein [Desulfuromonadales bacterium]|nr:PAS domain S-box protein [Desulfuromonadales bacterium]